MSVLVIRVASYVLTRTLVRCRREGHAWTTMAEPPACARCGRTGWYA